MKLTSYRLFCELYSQDFWRSQGPKATWLAARFYMGVDSLSDLCALLPQRQVELIVANR